MILFGTTPSNFSTQIVEKQSHQSHDRENWEALPNEVLLVGTKFALLGTNLRPVDMELDLSQYKSMLGDQMGKPLDEYIRYRVDKSCAVYSPDQNRQPRKVKIAYMSELAPPYSLYIK